MLYLEILYAILCKRTISIVAILVATICDILISLINKKWIKNIIYSLFTIIFIGYYMYFSMFECNLTISNIFNNVKAVKFTSVVIGKLSLKLLLFFIPLILVNINFKKIKISIKIKLIIVVLLYLISMIIILADNKSLAPYLEKIYNRGEFRVLKSKNRIKYDIAYPNSPVEKGYELIHALQAGPIVLPNLDLEKEFFIVKKDKQIVRQSASVLNKKARTVIGLKNQEDNIYIIIIEQNSGMDIFEVKSLCKKLGLTKALNLDGGGSTSLHYEDINITSENKPNGRKIKSFLLINTFKI